MEGTESYVVLTLLFKLNMVRYDFSYIGFLLNCINVGRIDSHTLYIL